MPRPRDIIPPALGNTLVDMNAPSRHSSSLLLAAPGILCIVVLLVLPLAMITWESFLPHVAGRIGAARDRFTLENYGELASTAYVLYFYDTFRIGFIACVCSLVFAYPIAHLIAHETSSTRRRLYITFFVAMMFLSVLARVYSIALTFSPVGFLRPVSAWIGVNPNGRAMTEILVIMGLVHLTLPIAALTLVGALQNINPRLVEAAQSLGAARWQAHLSVTLPLSASAALAAFLISYSLCISAFIIPMVLGKGRVLFVSNLIYSRFGEVTNFPGGAAISIVLLVITIALVCLLSTVAGRKREVGA
jgi:ABC-type spermidine/putrescine transport system permease subunit I